MVGIAISLRAGQSGDRIPAGGGDFPHPSRPALESIQPTGGEKRPGRGIKPIPFSAEVKERLELYLYPPLGFMAYSMVDFTFTTLYLILQPTISSTYYDKSKSNTTGEREILKLYG
jgi:hypothetical protein